MLSREPYYRVRFKNNNINISILIVEGLIVIQNSFINAFILAIAVPRYQCKLFYSRTTLVPKLSSSSFIFPELKF